MQASAAPAEMGSVRGKDHLLLAFVVLVVLFTTMFGVGYQFGRSAAPGCAEPAAAAVAPVSVAAKPDGIRAPKGGGTYLQVAAAEKTSAEQMARNLAAKGLSATVAPSPDPKLYRVLVGPVAGGAELTRLRESLKAMGLSSIARNL